MAAKAPSNMKTDQIERLLLRIVDAGLAGCFLVVPFLMGGRSALGQLVLVALAVAAALAWTIRRCLRTRRTWRWSGAELLLVAGVILLLVQLTPLPERALGWIAPRTSEILPLWGAEADPSARLGTWSQVALTPAETEAGLVLFLAYGLLFVVAVQRVRMVEDVERLLRWLALSAVLMAAFGLVQLLTSNGKFFWVYEHPFTSTSKVAKGSFTNRNHFAHFLALGIGPLMWWLQHHRRRRGKRSSDGFTEAGKGFRADEAARGLTPIGLGLVVFAILLSLSRGGMVAAFLAAAICAVVCWRARSMGPQLLAGLAAVALLIGVSLAIFGYDRVSTRLDTLVSGSEETLDNAKAKRITVWKTVAGAIPNFAAVGSGVGSHREVYPMYLDWRGSSKYYSHAESGYLQVALETGFTGLALLLAGIGICVFWCIAGLRVAGSNRILACVGAVCASLAASAAHSLVDFVWYVPACMGTVAILAACACRLWQLGCGREGKQARQTAFPRPVAALAALGLLVMGTWMIGNRFGPAAAERHWDRFLLLKQGSADALPFYDGSADVTTLEDVQSLVAADKSMINELKEVVRWDPDHAEAHRRLAQAYITLFHHIQQTAEFRQVSWNAMPLSQIRETVIESRSHFPTHEAFKEWLEGWLPQAIGEHIQYLRQALWHTRRGLRLCPLWGHGYLYLAESCFLDGAPASAKTAYVAQALEVRPFDGKVLFHAGTEAMLARDTERGWHYWQQAFHRGPAYQEEIVNRVAGALDPEFRAEEIRFLLETFDPDYHGLKLFYCRYRQIDQPERIVPLVVAYARKTEAKAETSKRDEAAGYWIEAMGLHKDLNDPGRSLHCGRKALECAPNNERVRLRLAYYLADLGRFADAEEHLRWLLRRKYDPSVEKKLRHVTWMRRRSRTAAAPSGRTGAERTQGRVQVRR